MGSVSWKGALLGKSCPCWEWGYVEGCCLCWAYMSASFLDNTSQPWLTRGPSLDSVDKPQQLIAGSNLRWGLGWVAALRTQREGAPLGPPQKPKSLWCHSL